MNEQNYFTTTKSVTGAPGAVLSKIVEKRRIETGEFEMKKGQIVEVFADPQTCEVPEGMAILVKRLDQSHPLPGYEEWMVRFTGEDESHRRRINILKH